MPNPTVPAAATGLPHPRRAFLRQLASLPLVGGGITLIGHPTAVAEPPTRYALAQYANWLFFERRILCAEFVGRDIAKACELESAVVKAYPEFHLPAGRSWTDVPMPSTRAALVMSAVGFDWRKG